jgi:hypothetical protein
MKRHIITLLSAMLLVGVILRADVLAQAIFEDDFDDGSINTALWTSGGAKNSWNMDPNGGAWSWSHVESGGDLEMRVWGPASGNTYGAAAWLQTKYNFNDGKSYIINFSWQPQPIDWHVNAYFIQVTDGWLPTKGEAYWWPMCDNAWPTDSPYYLAGTTNLLWIDNPGGWQNDRGWWLETTQSPGTQTWSVRIASSGTAQLYDAPNGAGQLIKEQSLDMNSPWYLRFVVTDATSAGFPAGEARLKVYHVAASVIPGPCRFTTSDFGEPMGKKKQLGSTLPVKFVLYYDHDGNPGTAPIEVAGQQQLNAILETMGLQPDSPRIRIYDMTGQLNIDLPEDQGNVGEGGDLGDAFRYSDGNWIFNLGLPNDIFYSGRQYKVTVGLGEWELTPGNNLFEIK